MDHSSVTRRVDCQRKWWGGRLAPAEGRPGATVAAPNRASAESKGTGVVSANDSRPLFGVKASPGELPVLRDALKAHRTTLAPKLWAVLESSETGR